MKRRVRLLTAIVGLTAGIPMMMPGTSVASTIMFRTDAQLIASSDRIVVARVINQRAVRVDPPGRRIYTVSTLALLEDLTGLEGDVVEVWELGGRIGDDIFFVGGAVEYQVGQDVLVCLERGPRGYRSIGMGLSKFDVTSTSAGEPVLQRDLRGASVVGGLVTAETQSLDRFRQLAAQVLGRRSRVVAANSTVAAPVTQPWTNLGPLPGMRWRDPDLGIPIRVYKNTSAAPPVMTGDAVPEIQKATAAWTNPASASITLQYAGTAFESSPDTGWSTIPEHSTLISFEDPFDELAGLVLAVGGGNPSSAGTGGTVGGSSYFGFINGFIIFQNAADLDPSFRESGDFTRVLTHELGHTIGFGHTQNDGSVVNATRNIMYPSCCYPETPVPPALGPDDLLGLKALYPQPARSGPTLALDKTQLRFGAVTAGTSFTARTSSQVVRLLQNGSGSPAWTATSTQPWLQVTPSSGTGPATLSISVVPHPALPLVGTADGAIVFTYSGASNSPGPIAVRLTMRGADTAIGPFGTIDTPLDNMTGVTGAVPVTGWALDDIEVESVSICRALVPGEPPTPNGLCGGFAQIFLGFGVFVEGARPDVHGAFPAFPLSSRGGWGFMVLTNTLPAQGNGTFVFFAYAQDRESRMALLGSRTLTCDNANAVKPFGTIDTPTQGGVASGNTFINFGWALTPQPKMIPVDGSTITVVIDGVSRGKVTYNNERADIETLFPTYRNTVGPNGAVGYRIIDTTDLSNGVHTISWIVTDDEGETEGIGSRYFTVSNGTAPPLTAPAEASAMSASALATVVDSAPVDARPLLARRGWSETVPWRSYAPTSAGRVVVRGEEIDRVELALESAAGEHYSGHLRVGNDLASLPSGSRFDPMTGRFTWAPGVGFVGNYDLVFVRWAGGLPRARRDVRVVLQPKTSGLVGPQVVIDAPRPTQSVTAPFVLGGWAVDVDAPHGTGVSTLHAWAYPVSGGPPIFLGATSYGGARPDVAAVHGDQFRHSGFGLIVDGLAHGTYDLAVFAWSTEAQDFVPARVVRVTIR